MAKTTKNSAIAALEARAKGSIDQDFTNYVPQSGGSADIPEGEYVATLESAVLDKDRNGDPYVLFRYVIMEGDYEGEQVVDRHTINERGRRTIPLALNILSSVIQRLGYNVISINNVTKLYNLLEKMTEDAGVYNISFEPDDYDGRIRILGEAEGYEAGDESDEEGEAEEDEFLEEEGEEAEAEVEEEGEEESSEWAAGDWCIVNDPQDDDSPWTGEILDVPNEVEAEVKCDNDEQGYVVRLEFLEPYEE